MARIVPAKPKYISSSDIMILEYLERGLSDDFIVIQPDKDRDYFLLLHPQCDALILKPLRDGPYRFDPDSEILLGEKEVEVDPTVVLPNVASTVMDILPLEQGIGISGWLIVTDQTSSECGSHSSTEGIRYRNDLESLSLLNEINTHVKKDLTKDKWYDIERPLQTLSPGASPYEMGNITKGQQRWRETVPLRFFKEENSVHQFPIAPQTSQEDKQPGPGPGPTVNQFSYKDTTMLIRMAELCVNSVIQDSDIRLCGLNLTAKDVVNPSFILPAILIVAADNWAPVVHGKDLKGGFHVRLKSNMNALFGIEVSSIHPSAPFLFYVPITRLIRSLRKEDHYDLEQVVDSFARWLKINGLDPDIIEDVDVRMLERTS